METLLIILVAAAMLATLGVLLAGVFGLARGSDPARSNALMRWRVVLQATALVLFLILVWVIRR
ncbi:twin transmembrane helix small protein [Elioraea rosea]|uniref:twin transmembrane helix small protein n=1 Tax=Elioraea rosea TaxID=2492390 RepID=UPI001182C849|nr:twin transmembrane helix small protein [Elioraea rosea]